MPTKSQNQTSGSINDALADLEAETETLSKIGDAANLNDLVLGVSPAVAAASLYVSNVNSLSILYENAVSAQQQQTQLAQNALNAGLAQLRKLTESSSEAAVAVEDPDQDILTLLKKLKKMV